MRLAGPSWAIWCTWDHQAQLAPAQPSSSPCLPDTPWNNAHVSNTSSQLLKFSQLYGCMGKQEAKTRIDIPGASSASPWHLVREGKGAGKAHPGAELEPGQATQGQCLHQALNSALVLLQLLQTCSHWKSCRARSAPHQCWDLQPRLGILDNHHVKQLIAAGPFLPGARCFPKLL